MGAVKTARDAGIDKLIGFDMGGTSTDVTHFAGEYERAFDTEVGGGRMRAPMLQIHTVAAGGGSVLHWDGVRMRWVRIPPARTRVRWPIAGEGL